MEYLSNKLSFTRGLMKAEKMMAKMGYREGEGLGKNKQGMSVALQIEKTGKRSGRIIHEKDIIGIYVFTKISFKKIKSQSIIFESNRAVY